MRKAMITKAFVGSLVGFAGAVVLFLVATDLLRVSIDRWFATPVMTIPLLVLGALALVAGVLLPGGSLVDGPFARFLEPVLVGELPAPLEAEGTGQALLLSVVATLVAGAGLSDPEATRFVVEHAPESVA